MQLPFYLILLFQNILLLVGNIPFGVPEEQLVNIFKEVGPVVSFRLVFDRDSGKPKGYGFCEYHDVETALCAVRNLNNHECNGRQLRVDFAENEPGARDSKGMSSYSDHSSGAAASFAKSASSILGDSAYQLLNAGQTPSVSAQATTSMEQINATLSAFTPNQLLDVLSQMKNLIASNPEHAKQLLFAHPPLAYALFQTLVTMQLVDANVVQKLAQHFAPQNAPVAATATPTQVSLDAIPESQRALLLQIMQLTPEQIDALPSDQRHQVMLLKSQIGSLAV